MANVLVIGLLRAQSRPGSRPFFLGFETFGLAALVSLLRGVGILLHRGGRPTLRSLAFLRLRSIQRIVANLSTGVRTPIVYSSAMLLDGSPQLVFYLGGGLLPQNRKCAR
jgi:hypothetical protein